MNDVVGHIYRRSQHSYGWVLKTSSRFGSRNKTSGFVTTQAQAYIDDCYTKVKDNPFKKNLSIVEVVYKKGKEVKRRAVA